MPQSNTRKKPDPGSPPALLWPGGMTGAIKFDDLDLSGRDLQRVEVAGSSMVNVDLRGANLSRANLSECNLTGSDLRGATLTGANLREANLTGVNLEGANLYGARIGLRALNRAKLDNAGLSGIDIVSVGRLDALYEMNHANLPYGYSIDYGEGILVISTDTISDIAKISGCDEDLVYRLYRDHGELSVEGLKSLMLSLGSAQRSVVQV
jgi:uncharacterized protein YjbI with pentapeptide repeats